MKVDYDLFINRNLPAIERRCTAKAVFISRREARSVVRNSRTGDGQLKPYHCRRCGGWHLGHRRHRPRRTS